MNNAQELMLAGPALRLRGAFKLVKNLGTPEQVESAWTDVAGWSPNLVVDQGLNYLGNNFVSDNLFWLSIGTGTNAAAASDTALQAFTASTSNRTQVSNANIGASTYAGRLVFSWTYAQGAVVGNMAEVGVGRATGGGSLFSRARIVDGGGSPTTQTVTALDQLTVFYKLTITPAITDLSSSVVISGTTYNYTARLANATQFFEGPVYEITQETNFGCVSTSAQIKTYVSTSTIGAITAEPSGTALTQTPFSAVKSSYTNGNFYRETTVVLDPTRGNSGGGIGAMMIQYGLQFGYWQYVFTSPIPKDNTKTLTLVVRTSWSN